MRVPKCKKCGKPLVRDWAQWSCKTCDSSPPADLQAPAEGERVVGHYLVRSIIKHARGRHRGPMRIPTDGNPVDIPWALCRAIADELEWIMAPHLAELRIFAEGERVGTVEPTFGSWQPIETAPKDGTEILGWHKEGGRQIYWFQTGSDAEARRMAELAPVWTTALDECSNGEHGWHADGALHQPTLWMPLPPLPEVKE